MRGICLVAVLFALTSCDEGRFRATEACLVICNCEEAPIDSVQDQCVDQCVAEAGQFLDNIPDDCLACITSHKDTCLSLEIECEPVCDIDDDPNPEPPTDEPPVIVDGGVPDAF
ncbi:MAG: hypothetical protein H0V17_00535 [Deltaproteobacteria bacterium]|nr:hypothetical protein [Deltaproteobacteria bacterium]